jgi:hypothetical protein
MDELGLWMRARQWRQWLVLGLIVFLVGPVLMAAWIGLLVLGVVTGDHAAANALDIVVIVMLAVAFPLMHRGMYRWMWHVDRRRATGSLPIGSEPDYGSEPTEPVPRIAWPVSLRIRHAIFYLAAPLVLLALFLPYDKQVQIGHFIARHSAGRSSAGSLAGILFGYLPMGALVGIIMLLTYRQMRRRDAGLLAAPQQLVLIAELNWLFAYAAAFPAALLIGRMAGGAIVAFL